MRVLLAVDCCPAGARVPGTVRRAGAKAVVVDAGSHAGEGLAVLGATVDGADAAREATGADGVDGAEDVRVPLAWAARLAGVLGLHADVVAAGLPVPLAGPLTVWDLVAGHVEDARADAVVVTVGAADVLRLVDAPALAVRVLDARLDRLAAPAVDDPAAASALGEALALRRAARALATVAGTAAVVGAASEHAAHGCTRPLLGLDRVAEADPLAAPAPASGVRVEAAGYTWWCDLPSPEPPRLEHDGTALHVRVPGAERSFVLPAALTRCDVEAAEVVLDPAAGPRLEVRLRPDPDLWR
ncbi:hypothetical protein [Aquipuribacter sp. SD81]|uniref:hypothetical protein n=1 Tax=Aquipuribacter sp. SD81 TaxID=3127703 RepID=UPI00301820E8